MSAQSPGLKEVPPVEVLPVARVALPAGAFARTFSSLRHRNFRLLWVGTTVYFFGMQMQAVVRGWLVYDMTGSALALGSVWAAMGVATLVFALVGGVAADRMEKRNLVMGNQGVLAVASLVVTALIFADRIQVWHLVATAAVMGIVFSFIYPGRQALLAELVDETTLMNAIALQNGSIYLASVAGPAVAGLLGDLIGVGGVYLVSVACFGLAMLTLGFIPASGRHTLREPSSPFRDTWRGLRYIRNNRIVLLLLLLGLVPTMFATPVQVLLPAFAADVLHLDIRGLGILYSVQGVGGLVGSVVVAMLGDFRRKGWLMLGASLVYGMLLVGFANSIAALALVLMGLSALAGSTYGSVNATLVQSSITDEFRGRVMSVLMLTWGLAPAAALLAGGAAQTLGLRLIMTLSALAVVLFVFALGVASPRLRSA